MDLVKMHKIKSRSASKRAILALAVAAVVAPISVHTQAAVIEEVIVTAQKREESNQEVPISITALGADALERRGIQNTEDLLGQIPGVGGFESPGSRGSTGLAIRGVSGGSPSNLSLDPAVATYLDGVFIGKMAGAASDVAELERVEILRGPQGTLYGRNATGGAVNYITRKPTGEFGLRAVGTLGDYDYYGLKLNLDTPSIGDAGSGAGEFAANVGVQTRERDGFYDNDSTGDDFNDLDRQAWRIAVSWNFRDSLFADYAYDGNQLDEVNNLDAVVGFNPLDAAGNVSRVAALQGTLAAARGYAATPGTDPRISSRWIPSLEKTIDVYEQSTAEGQGQRNSGEVDNTPTSKVDGSGHSLTLAWNTDNLTVKSITAYRESTVKARGDIDDIDSSIDANGVGAYNDSTQLLLGQLYGATGGFDPGIPQLPFDAIWGGIDSQGNALHFSQNSKSDYDQFSQEFQILGSTDTIEWVAGLYYFEDDAQYDRTSLALVPLAPIGTQAYKLTTDAWAVFGQATWTPGWLDDRIGITAGLRYTEEDKDIDWNWDEQISALAPPVPATSASNDESFDNVSGNLTVAFQATDELNAYLRYASGYRSGSFNGEAFDTDPFDEETIDTWEIGVKSDWWDGRMRVNAALYTYEWDDLQVSSINVVDGTPTTSIANAGNAERWGGEIEVLVAPIDDLVIGLSYAYLDGDFDEYPELCGTNEPQECIRGKDFANRGASPDNQASVYADYLFARTDFGEITGFLNVNWQDEWYTTAASTAIVGGDPVVYDPQVMDSRTVVDARLNLENIELGNGSLRVTLWGKNLTDEDYSTYGINFGANLGLKTENYGDPRTYGLEVAYEF
jgi:iron complex outermembrane receptor protein